MLKCAPWSLLLKQQGQALPALSAGRVKPARTLESGDIAPRAMKCSALPSLSTLKLAIAYGHTEQSTIARYKRVSIPIRPSGRMGRMKGKDMTTTNRSVRGQCQICGARFWAGTALWRYCSAECRRIAATRLRAKRYAARRQAAYGMLYLPLRTKSVNDAD